MLSQGDCKSLAKALFQDVESSVLGNLCLADATDVRSSKYDTCTSTEQDVLDIWGLEQRDISRYHLPSTVRRVSEPRNRNRSEYLISGTVPVRDRSPDVHIRNQDKNDCTDDQSFCSLSSSSSHVSASSSGEASDNDDVDMLRSPRYLGPDCSHDGVVCLYCIGCNHPNRVDWSFCEECGCALSQQPQLTDKRRTKTCLQDNIAVLQETKSRDWKCQMSHSIDETILSDSARGTADRSSKKLTKAGISGVPYLRHWVRSGTTGPLTLQHGNFSVSEKQSYKRRQEVSVKCTVASRSCGTETRLTSRPRHYMRTSGILDVRQSLLWNASRHSTLPGSSFPTKTAANTSRCFVPHILHLPDELLLYILSFLELIDLAVCARVSRDFHRVSGDSSLWKEISIVKRILNDSWLHRLSELQPSTLHLVCCRGGNQLSSSGLRQLFRSCAVTLQRLNVSGCGGGELTGDSLLLHCSSRCHNLLSLNVSWCHVRARSLKAVLEANQQLCDLDLSGCNVNDIALTIVGTNLPNLRRLHLYGNSTVTGTALKSLVSKCTNITDLNLGQCCKVNNDFVKIVANSLPQLRWLELRGCTQISDCSIQCLTNCCLQLEYLGLATCPNVRDSALKWLGHMKSLRSLDVTSCPVSDVSVQHVVSSIGSRLVTLKVGSTFVTKESILSISESCSNCLEELDLSYCRSVPLSAVKSMLESCCRLKRLAVYGLPFKSGLSELHRPGLKIELKREG